MAAVSVEECDSWLERVPVFLPLVFETARMPGIYLHFMSLAK